MTLHFTIDLAAYRSQLTQRLALVDQLFDLYREMKWRQARFESYCRLRRFEASCLRAFEKWVGCPLSKVILGIGHWLPTKWFLKRMKKGTVFVKGIAEMYRKGGASVVRVDESCSSCRCSPCGVLGRVGENSDYLTLPFVAKTNLTREADKRRQLDAKQAAKKADRQGERSRREAASGGILPNDQTNNGTLHTADNAIVQVPAVLPAVLPAALPAVLPAELPAALAAAFAPRQVPDPPALPVGLPAAHAAAFAARLQAAVAEAAPADGAAHGATNPLRRPREPGVGDEPAARPRRSTRQTRGVLQCQDCRRYLNRDLNAGFNQLMILKAGLQKQQRPAHLPIYNPHSVS